LGSIALSKTYFQSVLKSAGDCSLEEMTDILFSELPYFWCDEYEKMTPRKKNIIRVQQNTFNFVFDDYETLEESGAVPHSNTIESRLVGVLGKSDPQKKPRDDNRQRRLVGMSYLQQFFKHSKTSVFDAQAQQND
jgi:hypothetical protein